MKIISTGNRSVTVRFNGVFGLRQAIGLPKLISLLPREAEVTLDFTAIDRGHDSAFVALIPALASLRHDKVKVLGLEDAEVSLCANSLMMQAA